MAATFDKDMNIITNFLKDMDIIAALDDQPNDVGGLTAAELKAKFDEGGKAIQEYINGTLIPEVLGLDGTETARAEAEAARNEAETARAAAETARVEAETARAEAEAGRTTAETARAEAETARIQAEQQRADETAGIVAQSTAQATAAAQSASTAAASAATAQSSAAATQQSASDARQSATSAADAAETAAAAAGTAESWAVGGTGTREGEDANNAKYWSTVAQNAAGGGVVSFHSRAGAVEPEAGDYTAEMVGAVSTAEKGAAGGVATLGDDGLVPQAQLPEASGRRVCRLVVGTSTAGWTADDCDYLCDGTDDDVKIQEALDALPAEGGTVLLLDGTYVLNNWLIINGNYVTLTGIGSAAILRAVYLVPTPPVWLMGDYGLLSNVQIDADDARMARDGVRINGIHCTVASVQFIDTGVAIKIDAVGQWATVRDCIIPGAISGLAPYTRVLNSIFPPTASMSSSQLELLNNCYQFVGNYVDGHAIIAGGFTGLVADNYIFGPSNKAAVTLNGTEIVCRGNYCEFDNSDASYEGLTIEVKGTSCIVTDNLVRLKDVVDETGGNNLVANNLTIVPSES